MQEDEINKTMPWWEDKEFIKTLDLEYADWKSGKAEGYTIEEVTASLDLLRKVKPL